MRVFLSSTWSATDFSEVLESASRSAGVDLDDAPAARSPRALRSAGSRLQQLAYREFHTSMLWASLDFYLEQLGEKRTPQVRRPADQKSIADELCITTQMTSADLSQLRREFALANHPDRAGAAERENATRRMMIANMLIDREIKHRHAQRFTSLK